MAAADSTAQQLRQRIDQLAGTLHRDLMALAARDYPTTSPIEFIALLEELVVALENAARSGASADTARLISVFLKEIASHVRFLETSTYPNIPWALIQPIEKLIGRLLPKARFVFRSKWTYNYTIQAISEFYRRALGQLPKNLFDADKFFNGKPVWNIVSLPRIDRASVILHTILGHEAGHRVADQFLAGEDRRALQTRIWNEVGDGKWGRPDIDSLDPIKQFQMRSRMFEQLECMRSRAIEELASDLAGYHLFGPSFLFALREVLLDSTLDGLPASPDYYPPDRQRYRTVVEELKKSPFPTIVASLNESHVQSKLAKAFDARLSELSDLAAGDDDKKAIARNPFTARAYKMVDEAMPAVREFVAKGIGGMRYEHSCTAEKTKALVECLALGVPPLAPKDAATDFRDAIFVGCLYDLANLPVPYRQEEEAVAGDHETLHRLIHKAVEYCDLLEDYRP